MRVVLPREADAAVHLNAVLRGAVGGVDRQARGRGGGERGDVRLVGGAGGVPGGGARELGLGEHVGALVLHTLELADRAAELLPHLGVLGRGVDAPLGHARALGREHGRRQVPHPLGIHAVEPPRARYDGIVDAHLGDATGRVEALQLGGRELAPDEHAPVVAGTSDEHARQVGRRHRPQRALRAQPVAGGLGIQAAAERDGPHGLAGRQPGEDVGGDLLAGGLEHGRRQDRGEERARRACPSQFLEHHRQLGQAVALAAQGLVDVQTQPPLRRQVAPERRQRVGLGVQRRARNGRRTMPFHPTPRRLTERLVLFRDPDRHAQSPRVALAGSGSCGDGRQSRHRRGS